ncbi:hypothetical protein V9T40_008177 [Parthenolecanium corni]|uniref:Uncharacterized protein n=1 Tax=Parthenolecanium corni TaxID=536013 RepID=A0AAN9U1P1_9HEMI
MDLCINELYVPGKVASRGRCDMVVKPSSVP